MHLHVDVELDELLQSQVSRPRSCRADRLLSDSCIYTVYRRVDILDVKYDYSDVTDSEVYVPTMLRNKKIMPKFNY